MRPLSWAMTLTLTLICTFGFYPTGIRAQSPEPKGTVQAASPQAPQVCETDDRTPSADPRVGRLTYPVTGGVGRCTAWLVANGAILTAGHCVDFDLDLGGPQLTDGNSNWVGQSVLLEFDVPPSDNVGNAQPAALQNQFQVNVNSVQFSYPGLAPDNPVGIGRDWAIFTVQPNAGLLPHQTRGFFRVTNRQPDSGALIHVTGFGIDNEPNRNLAQQSAGGEYKGEVVEGDAVYHEYTTYMQRGTSGGPIIWVGPDFSMGINSHGRCEEGFLGLFGNNYNKGTSFDYAPLGIALNNFQGPGTVHVDTVVHPGTPNGAIFNPYNSINQAMTAAGSGAKISIVAGHYRETTVLSRPSGQPVTLVAPVGTVIIGQ